MIQVNRNPTRAQLRWFAALVFPLFWGWVAYLIYARAGLLRAAIAIAAVAAVVSVTSILSPRFALRVWIGMMVGLSPIGWVLSHLILGLIYYLVLTPIGLALRVAGRDPLDRRFDRDAKSYWIDRRGKPDVERYFRQY
ncbi:MAG TPA: SxtJ family membrane protein [Thermoanaerobaculia bacterium]|nr:SxtJ family membrane protein [Thermoanaerobaculia bacterium]